ncbi:hypothetical protein [Streptomyces bikiniensis]|uniref:hypothetical protein n=1 Tax=Streptomyces bikiniensis TaxID=1896 RepID=UPI0004C02CE1|nr:hypothetical protein [Streptomyces bikiniensis]
MPRTGEFRGDARLGPQHLPNERQKPVGPLLDGYHRAGKPSPAAFLKKYREGPVPIRRTGPWGCRVGTPPFGK